jgi:hypothetical protein
MTEQKNTQFVVYTDESAIPGHQRAWVWGWAALLILGCGLAAGWLLGEVENVPHRQSAATGSALDAEVLLARHETINQGLQQRIKQLEHALAGDACASAAIQALSGESTKP